MRLIEETMVENKGLMPGRIDAERAVRLSARANEGRGSKKQFEQRIVTLPDPLKEAVTRAYDFAGNIDYKHGNLSSETYLAHPLRVGLMALDYIPDILPETATIALVHNVLEVGSVSVAELREVFGKEVATTIETLTVDRSQQWDLDYKKEYYSRIAAGFSGGCQIKVLDKMDNMYMLGLNPDDDIRGRYLGEIRTHVLAMAKNNLPNLYEYMCGLADEVEQTGHFKMPVADD
jgi:(p)ppGpp synthase/HD superfamily hydrolase